MSTNGCNHFAVTLMSNSTVGHGDAVTSAHKIEYATIIVAVDHVYGIDSIMRANRVAIQEFESFVRMQGRRPVTTDALVTRLLENTPVVHERTFPDDDAEYSWIKTITYGNPQL